MAFTGIQATINFYTQQESDLTNELTDIMTDITGASRKMTKLVQKTSELKQIAREECYSEEDYDEVMDAIQDDYELELAKITEWESELEIRKEQLETEIKATSSYKESFKSALKQNVQSDFKYAQS
ncbi:MAG: hypothetical protein PHC64_02795 [Candidatus Gastranaerophilales bacterium]|nr:hypothetical protein [Candidatus Gastranaerophilales bacterium]